LIVVVDASTFVSAALKANSLPERALLRAVDEPNRIILSQEVEDEYREVLFRPKFDRFVSAERRQRILDLLILAADRVEPTIPVQECHDPKDDKYLALAATGNADVIVSSDVRHLLSMNEPVYATIDGKLRKIAKKEAIVTQMVNKSADADLRATKMLIDLVKEAEAKAGMGAEPEKKPFSPTDKEVVQQLIARLRRNMCAGCTWAAQRAGLANAGQTADAPEPV
jgi:uncharacterized protein